MNLQIPGQPDTCVENVYFGQMAALNLPHSCRDVRGRLMEEKITANHKRRRQLSIKKMKENILFIDFVICARKVWTTDLLSCFGLYSYR